MVPALFLSHGSPMIAIENTPYTQFLRDLGRRFKPKAVVVFTAHWENEITTVSSRDDIYETIYDFGGFPDELYRMKYPAKGSSAVAAQVMERLTKHGIAVRQDSERGLDHGTWTLLHHVYPHADIPVVQVSVNPHLAPEGQINIGQALQGIGAEDILVIGSGATVHNLRRLDFRAAGVEPWAEEFDSWLIEHLEKKDIASLQRYMELAPHAQIAVPRAEHFVPLYIAFGSGDPAKRAKVLHRSYDYGSLSYLCMEF